MELDGQRTNIGDGFTVMELGSSTLQDANNIVEAYRWQK